MVDFDLDVSISRQVGGRKSFYSDPKYSSTVQRDRITSDDRVFQAMTGQCIDDFEQEH